MTSINLWALPGFLGVISVGASDVRWSIMRSGGAWAAVTLEGVFVPFPRVDAKPGGYLCGPETYNPGRIERLLALSDLHWMLAPLDEEQLKMWRYRTRQEDGVLSVDFDMCDGFVPVQVRRKPGAYVEINRWHLFELLRPFEGQTVVLVYERDDR